MIYMMICLFKYLLHGRKNKIKVAPYAKIWPKFAGRFHDKFFKKKPTFIVFMWFMANYKARRSAKWLRCYLYLNAFAFEFEFEFAFARREASDHSKNPVFMRNVNIRSVRKTYTPPDVVYHFVGGQCRLPNVVQAFSEKISGNFLGFLITWSSESDQS